MKRSRDKGIEKILEAIKKQSKKASGHEPASPATMNKSKNLWICKHC